MTGKAEAGRAMIRKIPAAKLIPGMYVVDLHKGWFEHSLWRRHFPVHDEALVQRLIADGVTEVSIDTSRGADLPPEVPVSVVKRGRPRHPSRVEALVPEPTVSLAEERRRASRLLREATDKVQELIVVARTGRVVEAGTLEPVVGKMIESVARNPDALAPLARLKRIETYATHHAVATAALVIAMAQQQSLGRSEIEQLALGTLVKDVGQVALDARLITKPGELSSQERSLVHSHVEEGLAVLDATTRLPETAVAVVLEHHERYDGSGYPYHMVGEDISSAGRMAAIVDTYDAMTSDRPYRRALSPAAALKQVYEGGGFLFDPELAASFIRTVGIYPVGTLVRLESGHLAVVREVRHDDLLHPVVRVIFHAARRQYVTPVEVDLARRYGNHYGNIVAAEEFEDWGINPLRWQPA
ncbi:MAG: hypothetical protein H6R10_1719 [Rhodocyclaceae bacterium]|nr:hypothetical protein [Rhodocyclaceae bacterium]